MSVTIIIIIIIITIIIMKKARGQKIDASRHDIGLKLSGSHSMTLQRVVLRTDTSTAHCQGGTAIDDQGSDLGYDDLSIRGRNVALCGAIDRGGISRGGQLLSRTQHSSRGPTNHHATRVGLGADWCSYSGDLEQTCSLFPHCAEGSAYILFVRSQSVCGCDWLKEWVNRPSTSFPLR